MVTYVRDIDRFSYVAKKTVTVTLTKHSAYMHHSENYCGGCGVQMEYPSVRPITSKRNQIEVSVNISIFFSYIFKSHMLSLPLSLDLLLEAQMDGKHS